MDFQLAISLQIFGFKVINNLRKDLQYHFEHIRYLKHVCVMNITKVTEM
jgi:hypothetical protein